ncbi:MAG: permease, partial [Gammaproteobacteria bacterium]|nr:permease [Gammaproteobacteria bacterium]
HRTRDLSTRGLNRCQLGLLSREHGRVNTVASSRFANYRRDYFMMIFSTIALAQWLIALLQLAPMDTPLGIAAHAVHELVGAMWWGILLAVVVIGILDHVPQEFVIALLGTPHTSRGIFRAAIAGILLDLCSHGILMVGAKLYQRGASAGQVMAFLIASPWNSFSMTLILMGLIGIGWTLTFIFLSYVIAVITGFVFEAFTNRGTLPANESTPALPQNYLFSKEVRRAVASLDGSPKGLANIVLDGMRGARIVLRWLVFGLVVAAAVRAFVTPEVFSTWFGPSLLGLGFTLIAAAIFEVCSEGSIPIAADLMNVAHAPGNSFTFLLAGVATDYTEVMVMKEATGSWKIALFLPLVTVPQVLLIAVVLNLA